jgi:hypothetical protein
LRAVRPEESPPRIGRIDLPPISLRVHRDPARLNAARAGEVRGVHRFGPPFAIVALLAGCPPAPGANAPNPPGSCPAGSTRVCTGACVAPLQPAASGTVAGLACDIDECLPHPRLCGAGYACTPSMGAGAGSCLQMAAARCACVTPIAATDYARDARLSERSA